jgi:pilus assembly protein CpaF
MDEQATKQRESTVSSAASAADNMEFLRLKRALLEQLNRRMGGGAFGGPTGRQAVDRHVADSWKEMGLSIPEAVKIEITQAALHELFGFGPIQHLLDDPSVTEVMVNRADRVYVERAGKPTRTNVVFDDDAHVRRIIDRIIQPLGRRLDPDSPLVDARLPDGSRVNAVIPPVAIAGPCITIRKFSKSRLGLDDLVKFGALTPPIAELLKACVEARLNIVVCGGTGSGKTTLLNALSGCIPDHERIVTIEDAAELKLHQDHVITLEAKPANRDGSGEVGIRELVKNALRMRPERIIVGECRGAEALDMLQAMNTGHDGSLTTLHANSPRDAISRIETMALMAGIDFPVRVIREQMGSAIQLFIQQARLRDGSRKITYITEMGGMEGDRIVLQELFRFREEVGATDGKVHGSLQASGLRPVFMNKLEAIGVKIKPDTFMPGPQRRAA